MAAVDDGDSLLLGHVDRHRVEDRRLPKDHVVAGADLAELLAHDGVAVLDAPVTRNWKRGGGDHRRRDGVPDMVGAVYRHVLSLRPEPPPHAPARPFLFAGPEVDL